MSALSPSGCSCILAASLAVALAACEVDVEIGSNTDIERAVVLDVTAKKNQRLDLLFVVDNSAHMRERQLQMAQSFDHLLGALRSVSGELPDLHVGVISTDLGSGEHASEQTSCTAFGDSARMLATPQSRACSAIDGNFLEHAIAGDEVLANYDGELGGALSCITQIGEAGCDYEQPLEAMRLALAGSVSDNAGFLRPSAVLGVVFLTNEDDCSARTTNLFDPSNPDFTLAAPEWRCFSKGVRCGSSDDVFPPGWQADCVAREDSTYVTGVEDYVSFIRSLKSDPSKLVVSAVMADPELVKVNVSGDELWSLLPACDDDSGAPAYPGVRLRQFLDGFGDGPAADVSPHQSLCSGEPGAASVLDAAARKLRVAMGSTCLRGHLVDVDPIASGQQVDCLVYQEFPDRREALPECDSRFTPTESAVFPCYTIEPGNDACSHEPSRLSLRVYRSRSPDLDELDVPVGARLRAECIIDESL